MAVARKVALAAGLLVGIGLLTGCAGQPGVAATVGDETITTAELARTTAQLEALSPNQGVTSSAVLTRLVQGPAMVQTAAEYGVEVSDAEARDLLESVGEQSGTPVPTSDGAVTVSRLVLLEQKITASPDAATIISDIMAELADLDVTVNPRYGEYDPDQQSIVGPYLPEWDYLVSAS